MMAGDHGKIMVGVEMDESLRNLINEDAKKRRARKHLAWELYAAGSSVLAAAVTVYNHDPVAGAFVIAGALLLAAGIVAGEDR